MDYGISTKNSHSQLVTIVEDFDQRCCLVGMMEFVNEFFRGLTRVYLEVTLLVFMERKGAEGQ